MPRDETLSLLRTGYPWGPRLRQGKVAVPTRVFGRQAVLVGGPEGVRRFYDPRQRLRARQMHDLRPGLLATA